MSDRETFFPNDIPILIFEARRPDPLRFQDPDGVPAEPIDVEVRFFNGTNGEMVLVDGAEVMTLGTSASLLYMVGMDEIEDRGALIYVTIPQEVTSVTGNYTMYITTIYGPDSPGGENPRITQDQRVQISEYR